MGRIEKQIATAIVIWLTLVIGSCNLLIYGINAAFEGCPGVEAAIDKVWTGKTCENETAIGELE